MCKYVSSLFSLASSASSQSSSPAAETRSSSDEQDQDESVSGQENSQGCKRKRASVETETDRDSETDRKHQLTFQVLLCLSSFLSVPLGCGLPVISHFESFMEQNVFFPTWSIFISLT